MIFAKLSTAKTILLGPILDSDGVLYTGAAVSDIKICKNNGTPAALDGSATLTHKEVGLYELALTANDISAVGLITIVLSKTTYIAAPIDINVLPAKVYDSLVAGSDNLEVDSIQVGGTTQTGRDIGASVLLSVGTAAGQVNLSSGKVPATLAAADVTGNITADLQTIKTQTVTCAAGVTVSPFVGNATAAIIVNASGHITLADASLVTAKLGTFTLAKTTNITGFNDIAATAIVSSGAINTSGGAVTTVTTTTNLTTNNDKTGYALTQAFPTNFSSLAITVGGAVTVGTNSDKTGYSIADTTSDAVIADAVWNAATLSYGTANTYGYILENITVTPTAIADAVWDAAITDHLDSGSTGAALNAAGSAGDPWTTPLPGAYGAGTAGYLVGTYVNASVAAVLADTNELQVDWTNGGRLDLLIDGIKAKTDLLTFNTAYLMVDVVYMSGSATAANNIESVFIGSGTGVNLAAKSLTLTNTTGTALGILSTTAGASAVILNQGTGIGLSIANTSASASVNIANAGAGVEFNFGDATGNIVGDITGNLSTILNKLDTTMVLDGAVYDFTAAALAAAPGGGGGGDATLANQVTIIDHLEDIKGLGWTTESLVTIEAAIGAMGAGSGARTVVITVTDDDVPANLLSGATVRVTKGAETYTQSTSALGVATFNLDDGAWVVSISLAGYSYSGTTLTVNGDEAETYVMTAVAISPSAIGSATGYLYCYNQNGTVEAGVTFYLKIVKIPTSDEGNAFDNSIRSATSDANGLVQFTNLFYGARYRISRSSDTLETTSSISFTVPSVGANFEIPSFLGRG